MMVSSVPICAFCVRYGWKTKKYSSLLSHWLVSNSRPPDGLATERADTRSVHPQLKKAGPSLRSPVRRVLDRISHTLPPAPSCV